MRSFRIISVFFLLLQFTVPGITQQKDSTTSFFFIQVTDPQFGMYETNNGFARETELYEKAVSEINRLNPDFVVITGDLVNNKNDRAQVAEFKRLTAKINSSIPVWYSPGNHDIGQSPVQTDIDSFISDYGHDRFSFRHKKCLFIGLNSCVIKSKSPDLEQDQFRWLKKELSNAGRVNHTIIFSHYPFFINTFNEPETYSNIPVDTRKKYLGLFKKYKVDAVFAGHLHNNASADFGKMKMITTGAIGKPLANAPSGFRIVKVFPGRVESEYYPLDKIPQSVTLY
jgi:serine/threonine-protein phosphatase CPPED1